MDTPDDRTQMIVKLQRLAAQTRNAIQYLQSGSPLYPNCDCQPKPANPLETPNKFEIGDFVIYDRFTEPH